LLLPSQGSFDPKVSSVRYDPSRTGRIGGHEWCSTVSRLAFMTLVAAWVRQNSNLHELVIASDSRISGGESWDVCPKIVLLPRPATVMGMSGDAAEAYTFMLHAINTCSLLEGNKTGRTDLGYLARELRDTYADLRRHVRDLPFGQTTPDVPDLEVAVFAWSWRNLAFMGYSYAYDRAGALRMYRLITLETDRPYPHYLMGDAASGARARLANLRKSRDLPVPRKGDPNASKVAAEAFFDWEPLEVLVEMIKDDDVRSVGGVPQVIRIYQYGESEPFVWRTADGVDYFGGRPVQASERFDRRILELTDDGVKISFSDQSIYFGRD
jgi:hypothetical protein